MPRQVAERIGRPSGKAGRDDLGRAAFLAWRRVEGDPIGNRLGNLGGRRRREDAARGQRAKGG
jgi:hypothetical protein